MGIIASLQHKSAVIWTFTIGGDMWMLENPYPSSSPHHLSSPPRQPHYSPLLFRLDCQNPHGNYPFLMYIWTSHQLVVRLVTSNSFNLIPTIFSGLILHFVMNWSWRAFLFILGPFIIQIHQGGSSFFVVWAQQLVLRLVTSSPLWMPSLPVPSLARFKAQTGGNGPLSPSTLIQRPPKLVVMAILNWRWWGA